MTLCEPGQTHNEVQLCPVLLSGVIRGGGREMMMAKLSATIHSIHF